MRSTIQWWMVVCGAVLSCAVGSLAGTYTFTGASGADYLWTNRTNWNPNAAYPGQNDDVVFSDSSPDNVLTAGASAVVYARSLTFNRTNDYTIPAAANWTLKLYGGGLTATGGVVYSYLPLAGGLDSYSTPGGIRIAADQTWNIETGTTVLVKGILPGYGASASLTKTGAGDLIATNALTLGGVLNVQDGRVLVRGIGNSGLGGLIGTAVFDDNQINGDGYGGCNLTFVSNHVFSGTVVLSRSGGNLWWIIRGATNKWTLRGNGNIGLATAGSTAFRMVNGTVELDYSPPGESGKDRVAANMDFGFSSGTLLITGSTEGDVAESVGALNTPGFDQASSTSCGGIGDIVVNHGAGRNATLTFNNTAALGINSTYGVQLRFSGTNLTTGSDDLGTSSKVMFGSGAVTNGRYGMLSGYAYVGSEFASYDHTGASGKQGVIPLSGVGRPSDLNTFNGNVLTTGAVPPPAAAKTNNSLKIGGAHAIDLNGQTLTLVSGGIIQAGADNPNAISNGVLRAASGNTTGTLYIAAHKDLAIASNVTIAAGAISKNGAGKLTLYAAPAGVLYWNEGSLDYENDADVTMTGRNYYGPGVLTKGGTGTMTIRYGGGYLQHTGGIIVNNGALTCQPGGGGVAAADIGNGGPITVNSPGKLWCQFAKTFTGIALGGTGTIMANAALDGSGASNAFALAGCAVRPGGDNAVGQLSVNTSTLTFSKNGTNFCTLAIDVAGSGCDQLFVTGPTAGAGKVAGIEAVAANRTIDLLVRVRPGVNTAGPLTIVNAANMNFTGKAFNSVTWELQGSSGIVNYLNGSITLTNVKSPSGSIFVLR